MCTLRPKDFCCIKEVRSYGKTALNKNIVENGWLGGCIPPHPPLHESAPAFGYVLGAATALIFKHAVYSLSYRTF